MESEAATEVGKQTKVTKATRAIEVAAEKRDNDRDRAGELLLEELLGVNHPWEKILPSQVNQTLPQVDKT